VSKIHIYGSGLAGLVAAINLAREGYNVVVVERENTIGGSLKWHPAINVTPIQLQRTWNYIGINLDPCFSKLKVYKGYAYSKQFEFETKGLFLVERGNRKTSLDSFLYKRALDVGVEVEFSKGLTRSKFLDIKDNSIIATGLYREMFDDLRLPYVPIYGYGAYVETDLDNILHLHMGDYSTDYAYLCAKNGLLSCLLLSRNKLNRRNAEKFKKHLKKTEGIAFENWRFGMGYLPIKTQLFFGNKILAGSITGMLDPFFLFGINGALISGKISALAIIDRKKAISDFKKFTKHFRRSRVMKRMYGYIPFKKVIQPRVLANLKRYKLMWRLMSGGIPGFVDKDWFKNKTS